MDLLHFRDFSLRRELYEAYRWQANFQLRELKDHLMCDMHRSCTCNGCRHVRFMKTEFSRPETLWRWVSSLDEESI